MRSLKIKKLVVKDNRIFSFPILNIGKNGIKADKKFFSLSNVNIFYKYSINNNELAMISIYPIFDHLLRFYLPKLLWKLQKLIFFHLRNRIFIGRVCLGYKYNLEYNLEIINKKLIVTKAKNVDSTHKMILTKMNNILKKVGLFIPKLYFEDKTSVHYASSLSHIPKFIN